MRKLIITEFITADGYVDDPQNWSLKSWNEETQKVKEDELAASGAMLLGRVTYQAFAQSWPGRTGDFADKFNALPKFVASKTLTKADEWQGSELLKGPLSESVKALKAGGSGDIYVHGSITLSQELLRLGLVDKISLLSYPLTLGKGLRFFADGDQHRFELKSATRFSNGVLWLEYYPLQPEQ